jgi:hypothetical protein
VKFSTDPDDTHGKHFHELGDGEWDIPKLRLPYSSMKLCVVLL